MSPARVVLTRIALSLLAAGGAQAAQAGQLECPDEITPGHVTLASRGEWQPYVPHSLPLFGAGMSAGPPASEMQLRGEPLDAKGNGTSYRFGGAGQDEERWLVCRYGRSGEFIMSRRLDDKIRQCIIRHHKLVAGNPRRIEIRCS
ncbi:hypothetical protein OU994_01225 [Pseudoduganella sp. SL102]|uniref:STY0301 family protein n=1 Tax=Pseudoduganella sp. SL102 TaxID=2995154 RepID=UPI00248CB6FF|nr:STY0301 family protein [Pseudoduganella sp. SL102]WBS02958.1 hypothetical protein OU994_01225 [Pseudoduganella sp. SL102]